MIQMKDEIQKMFIENAECMSRTADTLTEELNKVAIFLIQTLKMGNRVFICGNGGSAAQAQHFAAELSVRFEKDRRALPVMSLTTDTSVITACANDYTFDRVFARQIEALGTPGDLLIGLTTSGNSKNVIEAIKVADKMNINNLILNGKNGGLINTEPIKSMVKHQLIVPFDNTARIQEAHIVIIHILCKLVEEAF